MKYYCKSALGILFVFISLFCQAQSYRSIDIDDLTGDFLNANPYIKVTGVLTSNNIRKFQHSETTGTSYYKLTINGVDMSDAVITDSISLASLFQNYVNLKDVKLPTQGLEYVTNIDYAFMYNQIVGLDVSKCVNLQSAYQAFYQCRSLQSVDMSNCSEIRNLLMAFGCCSKLEEVILPEKMPCLENYLHAFLQCSSLKSITLPKIVADNCRTEHSFVQCTQLESVTLPDNIKEISDGTFFSCPQLTDIIYNGLMPLKWNETAFQSSAASNPGTTVPSQITLSVRKDLDYYKSIPEWNILKEIKYSEEPDYFTVTHLSTTGQGSFSDILQSLTAQNNIITFDPSLQGETLVLDSRLKTDKDCSIAIIGNGIVIKSNESVNALCFANGDYDISGIRFSGCKLHIENAQKVRISACVFENNDVSESAPLTIENLYNETGNVRTIIECCRFSDNIAKNEQTGNFAIRFTQNNADAKSCFIDIVSSTFVDNTSANGIYVEDVAEAQNKTQLSIANSVFQNNKVTDIIQAPSIKSYGYNVIEGFFNEKEDTDFVAENFDNTVLLQDNEYRVVATAKAFENLPADTDFIDINLPAKDILGNTIDYSKPTHSGACQSVYEDVPVEGITSKKYDCQIYTRGHALYVENGLGYTIKLYNMEGVCLQNIYVDNDIYSYPCFLPSGVYIYQGAKRNDIIKGKIIIR